MREQVRQYMKNMGLCILLLGGICTALMAASLESNAAGTPTINIESATIAQGESVEVDIIIYNNPGITAMGLDLFYDMDKLTLTDIVFNSAMGGYTIGPQNNESGGGLIWLSGLKDYTEETFVLATLYFTAQDTAGTSTVQVTYDENDIFNVKDETVEFEVVPGTITVTGTSGSTGGTTGDGSSGSTSGSTSESTSGSTSGSSSDSSISGTTGSGSDSSTSGSTSGSTGGSSSDSSISGTTGDSASESGTDSSISGTTGSSSSDGSDVSSNDGNESEDATSNTGSDTSDDESDASSSEENSSNDASDSTSSDSEDGDSEDGDGVLNSENDSESAGGSALSTSNSDTISSVFIILLGVCVIASVAVIFYKKEIKK